MVETPVENEDVFVVSCVFLLVEETGFFLKKRIVSVSCVVVFVLEGLIFVFVVFVFGKRLFEGHL